MAGKTRQVIIGNSGAGLSALRAIRKVDKDCPVTIITDQSERAYSPVLTTYYIAGKMPKEKLYVTEAAFYRDMGVNLMSGRRAIGVDTASQTVTLDDGAKVEYDNLLIATGSSAKKPDVPGGDLPMVRTLRTMEDAEAIKELAEKGAKEVVVLGAGLVSLQTADAIYQEGMNITFLVGSSQVLSQNIDKDCARIIQDRIEATKVRINFGTDVEAIEEDKGGAVVISKTGERFPADLVIVGKGVNPNSELARDGGIEVDKGISVDEYMRTSVPNVYAAGDVAQGPGLLSGEREVVATWFNACHQGRIAGLNMAGKNAPFSGGLNRNITTLFGNTIASVGAVKDVGGGTEEMVVQRPEEGLYRKLILRDGVVQGAVMMGRIDDSGMATDLIQNRVKMPPREEIPESVLLNLRRLHYNTLNPLT